MVLIDLLNQSFKYWISADWYIALLMSFIVNFLTYIVFSCLITSITKYLYERNHGEYLNNKSLYTNQIKHEISYGILACLIFSFTSLITRVLFHNIWPNSLSSLIVQLILFTVYYESYSYFVHRFLHLRLIRCVHSVHHKSIRVTPWSAYSVHPLEAVLISVSAPIFMAFIPVSLSVILTFHLAGMMFTIVIHSNFKLFRTMKISKIVNIYTTSHMYHHKKWEVNFGFICPIWDMIFKTNSKG